MKPPPRNLAASIHRRLLNGARERGEDPQYIAHRYATERFLTPSSSVLAASAVFEGTWSPGGPWETSS